MRRLAFCLSAVLCWGCVSPNPYAGDGSGAEGADGAGSKHPDLAGPVIGINGEQLTAGTRLKVTTITGDDGSKISTGFYDSKLNVNCSFMLADDGLQRCLPTATATTVSDTGTAKLAWFVDSGCTQQIAFSSLCEPAVQYVRISDSCGSPLHVATVTPLSPQHVYFKAIGDTYCEAQGVYADTRYYVIGAPIAATEFVQGAAITQ